MSDNNDVAEWGEREREYIDMLLSARKEHGEKSQKKQGES